MRVNLDESAFNDPRMRRLARLLGCHIDDAIGRAARLWVAALNRVSDDNPLGVMRRDDAEDATDHRELVGHMLACGLASEAEGGVYFSGIGDRASFLLSQRSRGRAGGLRKAANLANASQNGSVGLAPAKQTQADSLASAFGNSSLPSGSGSGSGSEKNTVGFSPDLARFLGMPMAEREPAEHANPDTSPNAPESPQSVFSLEVAPTPRGESKTATARANAQSWVEWFNRKFDRRFTVTAELVKHVNAILTAGYSQDDMRLVAIHRAALWSPKPEMAVHIVPGTLLRPSNFRRYIEEAREQLRREDERNG